MVSRDLMKSAQVAIIPDPRPVSSGFIAGMIVSWLALGTRTFQSSLKLPILAKALKQNK